MSTTAQIVAIGSSLLGIVAFGSGCRDGGLPHQTDGSVELALHVPSTSGIISVEYEIAGNGLIPIVGSIDLQSPGATVSVRVNGLPPGTGYSVELRARSSDGAIRCSGAAGFDVLPAQTSRVHVSLQCPAVNRAGTVEITGRFNACPVITSYTVSPLSVSVGGTIRLRATAADSDAGDTPRFAWEAGGGVFSDPVQPETTFECRAAGSHAVTLTVDDGSCSTNTTFEVTCTPLDAGVADGAADHPSEEAASPDTSVACGADKLIELGGATFALRGTQTITKMTRKPNPLPPELCFASEITVPVSTQARLSLYQGLWYLSYEGPYELVSIPHGTEGPAVASQTSSPHRPFVHPTDNRRRGIPLEVRRNDGETLELVDATVAREQFPSIWPPGYSVPLCASYLFDSSNLFDNSFSGLQLTVSLRTGNIAVSHRCAIHHPVSGCSQPTLADSLTTTGTLSCENADAGASDLQGGDVAEPDVASSDVAPDGGGCAPDCRGTCVAGRCLVTLAVGQRRPGGLAVDGKSVYWTTGQPPGTVMAVSATGGEPTRLAQTTLGASAVAVDQTNVYWTAHLNGFGVIVQQPLSNEPAVPLAAGPYSPTALAIDGQHVYWGNHDGKIMKVTIGGGPTVTLVSGPGRPRALAANAFGVHWVDDVAGTLMTLASTGAVPVTLASGAYGPSGIAVDDLWAYWTDSAGFVRRTHLVNAQSQVLAAEEQFPFAVAIDEQHVYWVSHAEIRKAPKAGGAPQTLASISLPGSNPIAVDATSVYWAETELGRIMKLTPK